MAGRTHHPSASYGQQNILSPVALMEMVVRGEASTDWLFATVAIRKLRLKHSR
jgi:hypothetical protein